jgi:hypothetical protein
MQKYTAGEKSLACIPSRHGFLVDGEIVDWPKAVAEELLSVTKD